MSDWFGTQWGDWAAANQRQTFVNAKASLPSHRGQHLLFLRSFSHR